MGEMRYLVWIKTYGKSERKSSLRTFRCKLEYNIKIDYTLR
jgi:hypothetical protein